MSTSLPPLPAVPALDAGRAPAASGPFRGSLPRLGLRMRVAALCALLGFVISACLAVVAAHFSESYVHRLIDEMLRTEGDYLFDRYATAGIVPTLRSRHFEAYATGVAGAAPPAEFAGLPPGLHELEDGRGERHVAVYEVDGRRFYVAFDIGLEGARERRLARDLIALVLLGSGLACWFGWFWAGRAIAPVRRLAQQVEEMQPVSAHVALAPNYAADDVGALARAFDRYQERLQEHVRRERAFTADASHELRTPLAVIRGATEVLLDRYGSDPAALQRLKRVQRGSEEMRDLLDALLVLARGDEEPAGGTPDLDAVVLAALAERRDALLERQVRVEHRCTATFAVAAPEKVLRIVIGNLLRAAAQFAIGGVLEVAVGADGLRVACSRAEDAPASGPARGADERRHDALGLGMIRRVCERRGWMLEQSGGDGETAFTLRFA